MLDLLKNSLNVCVLGEEQMLGISGAGTCGVIAHYDDGSTCLISGYFGNSKEDAQNNASYINNNLNNGEVNQYSASYVTWCCDSCSQRRVCTYLAE